MDCHLSRGDIPADYDDRVLAEAQAGGLQCNQSEWQPLSVLREWLDECGGKWWRFGTSLERGTVRKDILHFWDKTWYKFLYRTNFRRDQSVDGVLLLLNVKV